MTLSFGRGAAATVLCALVVAVALADDPDPPLPPELAAELAEAGVSELVDLYLCVPEEDLRVGAANTLARRGDSSPHVVAGLLGALDDSSARVRRAAARALSKLRVDVVKALTERLASTKIEDHQRRVAACALERLGPEAALAAPALVLLLRDDADPVRPEIASALGETRVSSDEVLRVLADGVLDRDRRYQGACARALAKLPPDGIERLRVTLQSEREDVRDVVAVQLGNAPFHPSLVPLLVEALSDEDFDVRNHAAESLGTHGREAVGALPALIERMDEEETQGALFAVRAIGQDLKNAGQSEWWIVPRVYYAQTIVLGVALPLWWLIGGRIVRRRFSRLKRALLIGTPATLVGVGAAVAAMTRPWIALVLPEHYPFAAVPLAPSVGITVGLMCLLVSIAVTARDLPPPPMPQSEG